MRGFPSGEPQQAKPRFQNCGAWKRDLAIWRKNENSPGHPKGHGLGKVVDSNPAQPSGSPRWSPDGNRIAFDSLSGNRWEIYITGVAEQKPRKLITNISGLIRPHWSRDGKWVYFTTQLPGRIYRCPASGGDAIAVSKDIDGYSPQESFDGKTLYFGSKHDKSTLKQVALPAQPGTESNVDGMP